MPRIMPIRARRLWFAAVALCFALDAAAPFLFERAHTCACPVKAPCCKGAVCPMDAARRETDGLSFRSCGGGTDHPMANFLRWVLLVPVAAEAGPELEPAGSPRVELFAGLSGVDPVPDHPPRRHFPAPI
jgi:hypothetical protein